MTNEEMIQKYYDGDDSMLEKLYNENCGDPQKLDLKA